MEKVQKRDGLVCVCAECKTVIRTIGTVPPGAKPLVSHGICPACAEKLYGEIFRRRGKGPEEPGQAFPPETDQRTFRGRSGLILVTIS